MIDWLFYLSALLSFCTLLVRQDTHPNAYDVVLLLFSISVVAMFALGMMLRLYLTPRAEDKRTQRRKGATENRRGTLQGHFAPAFLEFSSRLCVSLSLFPSSDLKRPQRGLPRALAGRAADRVWGWGGRPAPG